MMGIPARIVSVLIFTLMLRFPFTHT
uniref:Uncharacterized protein n=1 Tax=Anguilla anguilla TaxID=7936 RepID=A0A0E9U8E3_ANGAN